MEDIRLAAQWYVPDNWYGQNYRVLLSKTKDTGFKNKTEYSKYSSKLVKYVKEVFNIKLTVKKLLTGKLEDFKDYVYVSMGPSWSCKTYQITVEELERYLNKEEK